MPKSPASTAARTIHGRALPDSNRTLNGLSDRIAEMAAKAAAATLGIIKPNQTIPLPDPAIFAPHPDSTVYGSTYYGIMLPDLPAPHYFMGFGAILGMMGIKVIDADHAVTRDGPRHTAMLFNSTACATEKPFAAYSMKRDMKIVEDGSHISFGKDAELSGTYPNFRLRSLRKDLSVNLSLTATGEHNWIAHSADFELLSLLVRYSGFIEHHGKSSTVEGLGTWDYWRASTPYLQNKQSLPDDHKVEGDILTHHVINLDDHTQYVLYFAALMDCTLACSAYMRVAGQESFMLDADVRFEVLTAQPEAATALDGYQMTLPATFRWTINCRRSANHLVINGMVDTPMHYGIGDGYAGGYQWTGTRNGVDISGRGYIAYTDKRD